MATGLHRVGAILISVAAPLMASVASSFGPPELFLADHLPFAISRVFEEIAPVEVGGVVGQPVGLVDHDHIDLGQHHPGGVGHRPQLQLEQEQVVVGHDHVDVAGLLPGPLGEAALEEGAAALPRRNGELVFGATFNLSTGATVHRIAHAPNSTPTGVVAASTSLFGSKTNASSPAPKSGRMTRSPGRVSRMIRIDWRISSSYSTARTSPVTM